MSKGPKLSDADAFVVALDRRFEGHQAERRKAYVRRGEEMLALLAQGKFSLCKPKDGGLYLLRPINRRSTPRQMSWDHLFGYRAIVPDLTLGRTGESCFYPRDDRIWWRQQLRGKPQGVEDFLHAGVNHVRFDQPLASRKAQELMSWIGAATLQG